VAFPAEADPVNTDRSTGSFTFDSSLIVSRGGSVVDGWGFGATDIHFAWGNTLWTTANADCVRHAIVNARSTAS
jgi:hypothetical protein